MSNPEPGPAQLSKDHERQGASGERGERKQQGRFYTDMRLAAELTEFTLSPLLNRGPKDLLALRICDPSAGAGAFLLAALQQLEKALPSKLGAHERLNLRQRIGRSCLYGVDRDPRAVDLAKANLNHAIAAEAAIDLRTQIRCGDALLGFHAEAASDLAAKGSFRWQTDFANICAQGGFDAIIGNPPWDILKPDSREFFARHEPSYKQFTKTQALACQRRLFANDPALEAEWSSIQSQQRRLASFLRNPASPFRHIGPGDLNSYKLFLEMSIHLLRPGGRLGMLVPAGIYSDLGTAPLRRFMLEENRWELLLGFENRSRVFEIDGRFKFAAIVLQKGGQTGDVRCAFMRTDPQLRLEKGDGVQLQRSFLTKLSPRSLAIPEIQSQRDHDLLTKIHANSIPFADEGEASWQIEYRREFDLTLDAERFAARDELEAKGFRKTELSRWQHPDGRRAFPLIEGRMIDAFCDHQKRWVEGRGRRALWQRLEEGDCDLGPQYLIAESELEIATIDVDELKIAFMAIGSATNLRSMYASSILGSPCGNSAPTLRAPNALHLPLLAVLNSFVYDYALRTRLGGNNLNHYILRDTPLPHPSRILAVPELNSMVAQLAWPLPRFAKAWRAQGIDRAEWISDPRARRHRRARIDALVARAYGLDLSDMAWILRDCDHEIGSLTNRELTRSLDQKGFWRVDRDLNPDDRLTQMTLRKMAKLEACES